MYKIYVRTTWIYDTEHRRDPLEEQYLNQIHSKLREISYDDTAQQRAEYRVGAHYYYGYPIPYGWRYPFLEWLNQTVGLPGSAPDLPPPRRPSIFIDYDDEE